MKRKHNRVIWYHSGKVTINGRCHREPTPASTERLTEYLWNNSIYRVLTQIAVIHTVRR